MPQRAVPCHRAPLPFFLEASPVWTPTGSGGHEWSRRYDAAVAWGAVARIRTGYEHGARVFVWWLRIPPEWGVLEPATVVVPPPPVGRPPKWPAVTGSAVAGLAGSLERAQLQADQAAAAYGARKRHSHQPG